MTGRPRLAPGQTGAVSITTTGNGTHRARIYVRDADGVRREVTATGKTRGAADRALQAKLQKRQAPTAMGVTANMTISELCSFFLDYRLKQANTKSTEDAAPRTRRKRRRQRSVAPQTVGAYAAAVRTRIDPLLGELRIQELTVGRLDNVLTSFEYSGVSTAQMRSVLSQALGLAVRHGAIAVNPMSMVTPLPREDNEVEALDLIEVALLRHLVRPEVQGTPGRRKPNRDLCEYVDVALGTGARISEVLALRWEHLDLDGELPTVLISGTLVEPRRGYVETLHRQEHTKSGDVRMVILPQPVVELLRSRRARVKNRDDSDPVFASRTRNWIWPNNVRTRLRSALEGTDLEGATPHSLRRTVGTTIAHELGLDTAREQLGHAHPGVTGRYYVARMAVAPDCREVLARFFPTPEATVAA